MQIPSVPTSLFGKLFASSPDMPATHPALQFAYPLPYGAIVHDGGVQFVVFSRSASAMRLLLYTRVSDRDPVDVIPFDRDTDRWGDIWSAFVPGIGPNQLYHFQADGPYDPARGHRFDPTARLIDPYARALAGHFLPADDGIVRPPKCVVVDDQFDVVKAHRVAVRTPSPRSLSQYRGYL